MIVRAGYWLTDKAYLYLSGPTSDSLEVSRSLRRPAMSTWRQADALAVLVTSIGRFSSEVV
jgi:hypothetical protein